MASSPTSPPTNARSPARGYTPTTSPKRYTGKWPGGNLPLGLEYDRDTKAIKAGDRAPDAIRLFDIFLQANGNATQAAWRINAAGISSPHGKLWTPKTVYRLVRSPFYRGKLFWDGREIVPPERLPEIVPRALVEQVDNLLHVTRQLAPRQRSGEPYSGLLTCSICGSRLVATSGRAGGVSYGSWVCSAAKCWNTHPRHHVSRRYIDAMVARAVAAFFQIFRSDLAAPNPPRPRVPASHIRRDRLQEERRRTVDLYVKQLIDEPELRRRVDAIDQRLRESPEPEKPPAITDAELLRTLDTIADHWPGTPNDEKRSLLLAVGASLTVNTSGDRPLWLRFSTPYTTEPIEVQCEPRGRWSMNFLDAPLLPDG